MGILNNTFSKKNKKKEVKAPLILSMPMFKGDSGYSLEKVIEDLKSYWGLTVDQIEGDDTTASFKIGEERVVIALMPAPISAEEFDAMYAYSYLLTLLLPKNLYLDFADFLLEDMLPIQLWVYNGILNVFF